MIEAFKLVVYHELMTNKVLKFVFILDYYLRIYLGIYILLSIYCVIVCMM